MSTNAAELSAAAAEYPVLQKLLRLDYVIGLVLVVQVLSILFVPMFATQDGPMHSFYSQVFANLVAGDPLYSSYYHIKSLFPPYSAHLYLLIFLNAITHNQFLTERILAAIAVALTFAGFTRLSRSITNGALLPAALCLPFLANWSLYMGFFNFTFGLGIVMFASGYWLERVRPEFSRRDICISGILVILLAAMHPIALAFFYGVAVLYLGFLFLETRRTGQANRLSSFVKQYRAPILFLLVSMITTYLWGRRFVESTALRLYPPTLRDLAERIVSFFSLNEIATISFKVWFTVPLLCVFLPALVFAIKGVFRRWREPRIATLAAMAAACFVAYLLVPKEFNTAYHFHRRFSLLSIFLILVLAGSWRATEGAWRRLAFIAVAVGSLVTLAQSQQSEVAIHDIRPALDASVLPYGSRIVEVRFGSYRYGQPLRYAPAMWAVAYWASRSHAAIMNMPWATQPYYPVQSNLEPDREPIDCGPLFLNAINRKLPLPMNPDAVVIERAVDHVDEQEGAIRKLQSQYRFHQLGGSSVDLTILVREGVK